MYRYQTRNRFANAVKPSGFRPVIVFILLAVAVFLAFRMTGGVGLNEVNYVNQRNAKIRSEVQHASSQLASLSRLGATSSGGALGRIRQYVHGIEVLNELNVGMYGEVGRLYEQLAFDNIYAVIDEYEAKLASGQKVNDSHASLTEVITQLSEYTDAVLSSE